MKVYVVLEHNDRTEFDYCGVYKTEEQAYKKIKEIEEEFKPNKEKSVLYVQEVDLE